MKLYVTDSDGNKEYLDIIASSRSELAKKVGGDVFSVDGVQYSIHDVGAELSTDNTALSMVLGGAIGLLGGVPGVIAGGVIGGLLGNDTDKKEKALVETFNRS